MNLNIKIRDQDFVLHPYGAVYWPEQEVLMVADVHLGKISHFRKHGSAVPLQAASQNFIRLDELRREFDPEHIVFMGDLFHSSLNIEWNMFEEWIENIDNRVHLVAGNHDIISPLKYEALDIQIYSEVKVDGFHLSHHPEKQEDLFNICGHIHPGYKMRGEGRQLLNLSCFYRSSNQLILPAFGEFTGSSSLSIGREDQVFVIGEDEVVALG